MVRVATRSHITADEYLAWERAQATKHEFFHGEVFAMAGGSPRHNALCSTCNTALSNALRARGCVVLTSDQRIAMAKRGRYVYPDVSVVCGHLELEGNDVIINPTIVVEVLSSSSGRGLSASRRSPTTCWSRRTSRTSSTFNERPTAVGRIARPGPASA